MMTENIVLLLKCKISSAVYEYISDIFNCYRANINGMRNARKLSGITFELH